MRNAVNLADGFWYQHSFMSLAMEVRVWGVGWGVGDGREISQWAGLTTSQSAVRT